MRNTVDFALQISYVFEVAGVILRATGMANGVTENQLQPERKGEVNQKSQRSLPERILVAFHHACDSRDLEAADRLVIAADTLLAANTTMAAPKLRRAKEGVVAAYERLWVLKRG